MPASQLATFAAPDSPLPASQLAELARLVEQFNPEQLTWASGYLAGLGNQQAALAPPTAPITVLYASHTGNGKTLAEQLAQRLAVQNANLRLLSTADYKPRDLATEDFVILIISTHGEGEVPESALELRRFLFSDRAPRLDGLQYAVFALGDSSYPQFCQAGREVDHRLRELGAHSLIARVDADVDFRADAESWVDSVLREAEALIPDQANNVIPLSTTAIVSGGSRDNPYFAEVLESRRITSENAVNDVHHVELRIDPRAIRYQPGDSLGIFPANDPYLVDSLLERLDLDGTQEMELGVDRCSLRDVLIGHRELTQLHPSTVRKWAEHNVATPLMELMTDPQPLSEYVRQHQFIDLVQDFPANLDAERLLEVLPPLQPRLYSIASSQLAAEDEIHLTVSAQRFADDLHRGTASCQLVDRIESGERLAVYIAGNDSFHLPADSDTPIIMIAAGTGIAPFRAFLQQREACQASGRNWLIFGNRHFHRDFLYQTEWQAWRRCGLLERVSLAFSRDDHGPAYVPDRLFEEADEIHRWLQQGAALYLCGSQRLAEAVDQALIDLLAQQAGLDSEAAASYLQQLRIEKRYLRDVY